MSSERRLVVTVGVVWSVTMLSLTVLLFPSGCGSSRKSAASQGDSVQATAPVRLNKVVLLLPSEENFPRPEPPKSGPEPVHSAASRVLGLLLGELELEQRLNATTDLTQRTLITAELVECRAARDRIYAAEEDEPPSQPFSQTAAR